MDEEIPLRINLKISRREKGDVCLFQVTAPLSIT
jgi:hypothetical protein